MNPPEFVPWPKIPRFSRTVVVTEKIDGTNAQVFVNDEGTDLVAGSRTRWITPEDDNYGFAKWVQANKEDLLKLGPGSHFGEWWGQNIQRKYGLDERRFSLFNASRWSDPEKRPKCCGVVPVIYQGNLDDLNVYACLDGLRASGSIAAPGFMRPEGIVIYHSASGTMYKKLLENDDAPKGAQ